jgi:hypothetical protein
VFIADGGVDGDQFYFGRDFGLRLRRRLLLRLGLRRRRRHRLFGRWRLLLWWLRLLPIPAPRSFVERNREYQESQGGESYLRESSCIWIVIESRFNSLSHGQ